jgi:hypothetical protein
MKKYFILILLIYAQLSSGETQTITLNCKGLSHFEIVGSSGAKEEVKNITYQFIKGELQDLNNIECKWDSDIILCESNFLNFRKLNIDLNSKKVSDFIAGNKGFGQYTESFEGTCD